MPNTAAVSALHAAIDARSLLVGLTFTAELNHHLRKAAAQADSSTSRQQLQLSAHVADSWFLLVGLTSTAQSPFTITCATDSNSVQQHQRAATAEWTPATSLLVGLTFTARSPYTITCTTQQQQQQQRYSYRYSLVDNWWRAFNVTSLLAGSTITVLLHGAVLCHHTPYQHMALVGCA
jgi:hypothetical protein